MELTFRAAVVGVLLGAVLAAGNVYMGLRTGFWEIGVVTATVIGAAVLPVVGRRFNPVEITLVQSIAVSAGAVPASAGLLGAVPGLALLGMAPPRWTVVLLGLGAGGLGLVLAHALRRRLLEDEQLPFPSGIAAAEVLRVRSGGGAGALGIAGVASGCITLLRELGRWPAALLAPGRAGTLGLGVAISPMLVGIGALIGVASAWAIALGAGIAWIWIAPALVRSGMVADASFGALAIWLLWPGVGLMLGGAIASLSRDARAFRDGAADLRLAAAGVLGSRTLAWLAALTAGVLLLAVWGGFGLGVLAGALTLPAAVLAAVTTSRVAGRTDVAPSGEMGQVIQGAGGALGLGPAGCSGAGTVAVGLCAQSSVALWSLRAGAATGVAPPRQARAHLLGLAAGVVLAVPVYELFLRVHALGSVDLPAPTAVRWRALAALASGGHALPVGAGWVLPTALAAGVLLDVAGRTRLGRLLPPPGVLGLGFLIPAHYAVGMLLGSVMAWGASRRGRDGLVEPAAAGAIAGESLTALVAAALTATGLLR